MTFTISAVVAAADVGNPWERADDVRTADPGAVEAMAAGFATAAERSSTALRSADRADTMTAASHRVDGAAVHDAAAATAATRTALGFGGEHPALVSRSLRTVAAELRAARGAVDAALARLDAELRTATAPRTVPAAALAATERTTFEVAVDAVRRHGTTVNTAVDDYDRVLAGHTRLVDELATPPRRAPGAGEANPPPDEPADPPAEDGDVPVPELLELLLDLLGTLDPTPVSDAMAALLSLRRGDLLGAGISLAGAFVPFFGDAAKLAKFRRLLERYPHLRRFVANPAGIAKSLKHVDVTSPGALGKALTRFNTSARDAEKRYAKRPRVAGSVEAQGLPTEGPIPFVAPRSWDSGVPRKVRGGFLDEYGNIWRRDLSKKGQWDEWDVELPRHDNGFKQLSKDDAHLNVDPDGVITH